jgi:hypothetical protein
VQLQDGSSGDDFGKDSVERDERRLTELGRRTVEMFVLAHLYTYVNSKPGHHTMAPYTRDVAVTLADWRSAALVCCMLSLTCGRFLMRWSVLKVVGRNRWFCFSLFRSFFAVGFFEGVGRGHHIFELMHSAQRTLMDLQLAAREVVEILRGLAFRAQDCEGRGRCLWTGC